MALNGTLIKNVSSGYRLQLEWSATQDKTNNTSTITAKLYWISLGSSYTINSSTTKSGQIEIGGDIHTFSGAGLADLNGNQKKLISTSSDTVSHNSDGTLRIWLAGYFSPNVTLSGTYYGQQSVTGTVTLDSIPRESSITSSLNFTAPNAFPISISRNSTSYTHTVRLYVDGVLIKALTGIGTSTSVGWSTAEMTTIFTELAQTSSKQLKIELDTMNGSTKIGSTKTYYGTCFAEDPSTNVNSASFNIGDTVTASIARNNSSFKHVVKFYVNGSLIHTSPQVDYTYVWTPTTDEKTLAFSKTPNSNSVSSKIEVVTYYNNVQVDQPTNKTGTASVVNSSPTFGSGFTYEDTNATTLALTGNKAYIIQKKSTVKVVIPVASKATAINGASMVKYTASLDGQSQTQNWSNTADIIFNFTAVSAGSNLTLSIMAIDSRGNATKSTKTVTVVPYSPPSMSAKATRKNNFEAETNVSISGTFSAIDVGGTTKNAISKVSYRYKENVSSAVYPSVYTDFVTTTTGLNYSTDTKTITLDQTKGYIFEFKVTDKLGDTFITRTVNKGLPIFYVDEMNKAIGVNKFPATGYAFDIAGKAKFEDIDAKNLKLESIYITTQSRFNQNGLYALNANNGDLVGVNGIYMNDSADNDSEGINFPKSGVSGSTNIADYDSFRIKDGAMMLNSRNVLKWDIPPTEPTLYNGWQNYYPVLYARTFDGVVHLQGLTRSGTIGATILQFPDGCKPINKQLFYLHGNGGVTVRVEFNTDGTVVATAEGVYKDWISFAGVNFMASM